MLLDFRVENFRSFRDEQGLSLIPTSDKSLPENLLKDGEYAAVKAAAIFGPNASGKTNLIKAVDFFINFIERSKNPEPRERISFLPFQLDLQTKAQPSEFEAVFVCDSISYQYGFSLMSDRIYSEWLYAFPRGRAQTWFTRKYNLKTESYDWKFGTNLKGSKHEIAEKTLGNALFLSVAAQWNNEQLFTIYNWLTDKIRVMLVGQRVKNVTSEMLLDDQSELELQHAIKREIVDYLRTADLGIKDIIAKREDIEKIKVRFPKDMPENLQKKILENMKENPPVSIDFIHSGENNCEMILPLNEESDGTQKLFDLLGPILETIAYGYTVFIDELESSLHPLLMATLIKMINDFPNGAGQVIFTTHSTALLRSDLLRRDQIWFTEKDNSGSSKLYPLSDYMPRKGEAIEKNYLSGRYGAIPVLQEFGING